MQQLKFFVILFFFSDGVRPYAHSRVSIEIIGYAIGIIKDTLPEYSVVQRMSLYVEGEMKLLKSWDFKII